MGCQVAYSGGNTVKLDCVSVENNVVDPPPLHPVVRRMAEGFAAATKRVHIIYGGVRLPERWSFLPPFTRASELRITFGRDELLDVHDDDFSTIPGFLINEPDRYPNVKDLILERIGRSTGGDSVIADPPNPLSRIMTTALPSLQRPHLLCMAPSVTAQCLLYLRDRTAKLEELEVSWPRLPVELPPLVLAPPLVPPVKQLLINNSRRPVWGAASVNSLFSLALLLMPDTADITLRLSHADRNTVFAVMQCVRRCGRYYDVELPIPDDDDGEESPTFIVKMTKKAGTD